MQSSDPATGLQSSVWFTLSKALRSLRRRLRRRTDHAIDPEQIRALVGLRTGDLTLYEQALRHRSLLRNQPKRQLESNERLEFLGDAVLGMAVAEFLYENYPDKNEGFLTRTRSKLVSGDALAQYAHAIGLDEMILMSDDMERAGGRKNTSILADAYEAILGALYLDQGLSAARTFILKTINDHVNLSEVVQRRENYKSLLLEYAQAHGLSQPRYTVLAERGPSHRREFSVEVLLNNKSYGKGTGYSKKTAEQRAAQKALKHFLQATSE